MPWERSSQRVPSLLVDSCCRYLGRNSSNGQSWPAWELPTWSSGSDAYGAFAGLTPPSSSKVCGRPPAHRAHPGPETKPVASWPVPSKVVGQTTTMPPCAPRNLAKACGEQQAYSFANSGSPPRHRDCDRKYQWRCVLGFLRGRVPTLLAILLRVPLALAVYVVALQRRPGSDLVNVVAQALPFTPCPAPAACVIVGTAPTGRIGPPGAKVNAPQRACPTLGCCSNGLEGKSTCLVVLVHSLLIPLTGPRQSLWQGPRPKGLRSRTPILEVARDLPSPTLGGAVERYEIHLVQLFA